MATPADGVRDLAATIRPPGRNLVMFDWDGVLADSLASFASVFPEACRRCGFGGLDAPGRLMRLFDDNMYAAMKALGMQPETIGCVLGHFRRDTLARLDEIRLFEGIPEALERIAAGNAVVVVTSNLSGLVRTVLEREGVRCVTEVLGVEAGAGKVQKIRQAMARAPRLPAFYVGDTLGDMREGRSAGAMTVAALWGWHGEERLRAGRPDFLARSPRDLAAFFG